MKLISVTIVRSHEGPDNVSIETDLKEGTYPYTEPLFLMFKVARGQAESYLATNFPELLVHHLVKMEREHEWEFYMNGTFCKRCGTQIGSGTPCR